MLKKQADWISLGSADEQKPAVEGTVEAWARSDKSATICLDEMTEYVNPGINVSTVPPVENQPLSIPIACILDSSRTLTIE